MMTTRTPVARRGEQPGPETTFLGFWHGPPLGPLRLACLRSFLDHGHRFEIYTYEEQQLPHGIVQRDANEIIPLDEVFHFANPHTGTQDLGPFSDLFRFKLLSERGGWWVDVDTICLSPDIPVVPRAWAQQIPEVNPAAIGPGQIAFEQGDPLVAELYERCLNLSRTAFHPREALGPMLLSQVIEEKGLPRNQFGSADTFYPIRWIEMFKLWLPEYADEIRSRISGAYFLPIFQSFPQYIGLELSRYPPKGSILGDLCDHPDIDETDRYRPEAIRAATRDFFAKHEAWAIDELRAASGRQGEDEMTLATLF